MRNIEFRIGQHVTIPKICHLGQLTLKSTRKLYASKTLEEFELDSVNRPVTCPKANYWFNSNLETPPEHVNQPGRFFKRLQKKTPSPLKNL